MDEGRVESHDFERCMPAWANLSNHETWAGLIVDDGERPADVLPMVPLVQHCLFSLHEEEVVIRAAAVAAVKALVLQVSLKVGQHKKEDGAWDRSPWVWLLTSSLLPSIRAGVGAPIDHVRQVSKPYARMT